MKDEKYISASKRQRKLMDELGVPYDDTTTQHQATKLINKAIVAKQSRERK